MFDISLLSHSSSILIKDEECSIPGKVDDKTLLTKLSKQYISHPNFECSQTNKKSWKPLQNVPSPLLFIYSL